MQIILQCHCQSQQTTAYEFQVLTLGMSWKIVAWKY